MHNHIEVTIIWYASESMHEIYPFSIACSLKLNGYLFGSGLEVGSTVEVTAQMSKLFLAKKHEGPLFPLVHTYLVPDSILQDYRSRNGHACECIVWLLWDS